MVAWHRSGKADLCLRAAGALLCGLAYLAGCRLFALPAPARAAAYALAALGMLSGSAGLALALAGRHLFDEVEVSARWRREDRA